jgi:hypothetical protein
VSLRRHRIVVDMDIDKLNEIRRLAIVALFSDDDLMDVFVLKGGNAINLIYELDYRASQDIDVSMCGDFEEGELEAVREKLERALKKTFKERGYSVFDVRLEPRPVQLDENNKDFWGGYQLEFKIIESSTFDIYRADLAALRRRAVTVREDQKKTFKVDISKHEFCAAKEPRELEGHRIYVYTPVMLVYEKLRALCQQMEAYHDVVPTHISRARGRDFFDIYLLMEKRDLHAVLHDPVNLELLIKIFAAKRVPLVLLSQIRDEAEFHRLDFLAVMVTVATDYDLRDFDFYFDYVVQLIESLKSALERKASSDQ